MDQITALNILKTGKNVYLTGKSGCYDAETEFLTPQGWKKFPEYKDGDQVAQFDINTNKVTFVQPLDYIKLPFKEEFKRYSFRGVDMCLSPEHKVLYYGRTLKNPKTILYNDLLKKHAQSKLGFSGSIKTTFTYDGPGIDYSEGELRLQVAVMADGRIVKHGKDNYTQMRFTKKRKYDRLLNLCEKYSLLYKDNGYKKTSNSYEVIVWPKSKDKFFDSKYYQCSEEQLSIIVDEVRYWDSHVSEKNYIQYSTIVKENVDFLQFAFASQGYITCIYIAKNGRNELRLSASKSKYGLRNSVNKNNKISVESVTTHDGFKYCFTVPTGFLVVRRSNKIFISGNSGKSYTIRQYIAYLRRNKIPVAVTGSTGIAAINVNGTTIHSWSGIGINSSVTPALIKKIQNNRFKYESIMSAKVLIIDEISMLHAIQFNMVDQVLKTLRNNDLPFGGLQIICVGDHNQLPPVDKEGRASKDKFCFMTPAWVEADFKVCYLTEVHRQSAGQFVDILNAIRAQTITTEQIQVLKNTINNDLSDTPLHLYTHNVDVEMLNVMQLEQLQGDKVVNVASEMGDKYLIEQIKANARAPERLELKINAKVMFVRNDVDGRYVNGTQGTVKSFIKIEGRQVPVVMTLDGHEIVAQPVKWTIENNHGKPLAIYSQVPLRLAYAITVHSSQGMTLQEAEIDLTKTFEAGQGYVALSRLKTIESLRLIGVNQRAFLLDSLALKADKRFLELSAVNVKDYTAVRSTEHTDFLKRCKSRR